jgi:two-component system chemotaxis response regulator CheB
MQPLLDAAPAAIQKPVRVVVCDDSQFMRRMITRGLGRSDEMEVVGVAATAKEAIELCSAVNPDVLTLDLELPDGDGLEVIRALASSSIKVLVVSSFTVDVTCERAVEALATGAVDCLGKPGVDETPAVFVLELLERVRSVSRAAPAISINPVELPSNAELNRRLIVIGASTGGPRALTSVLQALPADFGASVVIVQHMPEQFTGPFARRLDRISKLTVREAVDGALLEPGVVHIAAGGHHLHVEGGTIGVRRGRAVRGYIPSIDVTMYDAAQTWGSHVTGVVLTGIGVDGCDGARAIRDAGGSVLVEERSTCAVWGMPRAVEEAGLASGIVPLGMLPGRLVEEVYR